MQTLQVKINNQWKYVFCSNKIQSKDPITTEFQCKALRKRDYDTFCKLYPEHQFRISKKII
jgi:hypothetical protein